MCVHVCARIHARLLGELLFPLLCQHNLSSLSTLPQNQVKCWSHALEMGQRLSCFPCAQPRTQQSRGWARPVVFPAYSICLEVTWFFLKGLPIEACPNNHTFFPLVTWILNYSSEAHVMSGLVHEKVIKKIRITTSIMLITQRHCFWALLTIWAPRFSSQQSLFLWNVLIPNMTVTVN